MDEHRIITKEEMNAVAHEVCSETAAAMWKIVEGRQICPGCFAKAITIGLADTIAELIVTGKQIDRSDDLASDAVDRIFDHVEFLSEGKKPKLHVVKGCPQ